MLPSHLLLNETHHSPTHSRAGVFGSHPPLADADSRGEWCLKPKAAFVQTPQDFYNLDSADALGHAARFFYGPMLQGRDGVGACPCVGTGVIFRRDILVSMGGQAYAPLAIPPPHACPCVTHALPCMLVSMGGQAYAHRLGWPHAPGRGWAWRARTLHHPQ